MEGVGPVVVLVIDAVPRLARPQHLTSKCVHDLRPDEFEVDPVRRVVVFHALIISARLVDARSPPTCQ